MGLRGAALHAGRRLRDCEGKVEGRAGITRGVEVEVEERGGMAALTAGAVRLLQARGWDHRLTDLTLNFCTIVFVFI